jgi:hypothetical protein
VSTQTGLTLKSRNAKTGPIPVSTTTHEACPKACPLASNGCYAEAGPLAMFWRKVTEHKAGKAYGAFVDDIAALPEGQLWRHNQAGDLAGDTVTIDAVALGQLVAANHGKRGFTYTHYDVTVNAENAYAVSRANAEGFTVNLSANNLEHADKLAALSIGPVVVVLPGDTQGNAKIATPEGRKVVVCPATYREDVSCATCGLCQRQRSAIVGFPVHGTSAKRAEVASKSFH